MTTNDAHTRYLGSVSRRRRHSRMLVKKFFWAMDDRSAFRYLYIQRNPNNLCLARLCPLTRLARKRKINRTKRDTLFVKTGVSYQMEVCLAVIIDLVISPVSIGGSNVLPVIGREVLTRPRTFGMVMMAGSTTSGGGLLGEVFSWRLSVISRV
ncbi:hypothetical protein LY78DRAFT_271282 [Colletotrichum sublineola]|nr:hypothetical protein LY78DRAFT_271282 [Colletotrichum sublineola]